MRTIATVVVFALSLAAADVAAQSDEDDCVAGFAASAVTLLCRHTAAGPSVSIVQSSGASCGGPRPLRVERFGADSVGRARNIQVDAGEAGECRYADGRTVRVRAELEPEPRSGACSADPAVRFSLWLDGRKLRSRAPVSGRCQAPRAGWHYRIDADGAYDCSESTCVALPDPATLPVDALEYPARGQTPAQAGSLRRLLDRDPVCAAVERELRRDWRAFDVYAPRANTGALHRLNAPPGNEGTADGTLPTGLEFAYGGSYRNDFDFDNDGLLDRVFSNDSGGQGGAYFSPLLVQSGSRADRFEARAGDDALVAVPCQWDPSAPSLGQCDDLRSATAQARPQPTQAVPAPVDIAPAVGVDVQREFFRTRYTTTLPFAYRGATFIALFGAGTPSRDYLGVYRPAPRGAQRAVCLIQRVPANM
ncbi:hypothetical protein [Pseudomonas sp. CGJS7]|uniref:hypothetical protein n=1 Tax=Pseudomonas sp. CGJS7 TaxID=3109348 RepID=UPI00300937CB